MDSQIIVIPSVVLNNHKYQTIFLQHAEQTELEACAIGEQYAWFPKEKSSCDTCQQTTVSINKDEEFYCIVSNRNGCTDTCFYTIELPFDMFIPTAFTPNGDGMNDQFEIKGKNLEVQGIEVYDRWGNEVYKCKDCSFWDGKKDNENAPSGIYAYTIKYKNLKTGTVERKSGAVNLMR